jgi:hypothetical protein
MLRELQLLMAKEGDLKRKIKAYEAESPDVLHIDRVVTLLVPGKNKKNKSPTEAETTMETVIKASPFDRAMKIETELNRTHGRIIKLIDSIKAYELESRRFDLEERKYRLAKQKLAGEFDIDPETGEINDTAEQEDDAADLI